MASSSLSPLSHPSRRRSAILWIALIVVSVAVVALRFFSNGSNGISNHLTGTMKASGSDATTTNPNTKTTNAMNPIEYSVANGLPGYKAPNHRGDYIEIYSDPITTRYSEVYWKSQKLIPLPPDFVKEFENSVVGFTGYEVDIQRQSPTDPDKYESVPTYEQYNHHFTNTITGGHSTLAYVGRSTVLEDRAVAPAHRHAPAWEAMASPFDPDPTSVVPTAQLFIQGNGGEHRGSFKYLPVGFVQMIESPQYFAPNFMMINTKNPNKDGPGGPLPRSSRAPPGAKYSGLLECPCTTRIKKVFTNHITRDSGTCQKPVSSADECWKAATGMGMFEGTSKIVKDSKFPPGCFVVGTLKGFEVYFNNETSSTVACGADGARSVVPGYQQYYAPTSPTRVVGEALLDAANVTAVLDIDRSSMQVKIQLSGPATGWFAVGFGAQEMGDLPYTIVIDGDGNAHEQKLADHAAGDVLEKSIHIESNQVDRNGTRTVVLTRALKGATTDHYTFDPTKSGIPLIGARGDSKEFGYHGPHHASKMLMLIAVGSPTCICRGGTGGTIDGHPFVSTCHEEPATTISAQKNPSCSFETYGGGLYCCRDGTFLLDADQEIPAETDTYRFKFRFYYEKISKTRPQENSFFMFREVEYNHGEYDVPKCEEGTPPEYCEHTITGHFQVKDTIKPCRSRADVWCAPSRPSFPQSQKIKLLHISGHCHAPACISIELINADTGQTICKVEPVYGQSEEPMNEAEYIVGIPPCIWGSAAEGLMEPPVLSLDTNLTAIKKANSTNFHYGVMSHLQMRGAWVN